MAFDDDDDNNSCDDDEDGDNYIDEVGVVFNSKCASYDVLIARGAVV